MQNEANSQALKSPSCDKNKWAEGPHQIKTKFPRGWAELKQHSEAWSLLGTTDHASYLMGRGNMEITSYLDETLPRKSAENS